jgi:hypothetical protein
MNASTEQYIALLNTPPVTSRAAFQAAVLAFQSEVPRYTAELALESAPLQDAAMTEPDAALSHPLNNALQRTQFLQNRIEKLTGLLQEIRVGLVDLGVDQTAVIDGGYPAPAA